MRYVHSLRPSHAKQALQELLFAHLPPSQRLASKVSVTPGNYTGLGHAGSLKSRSLAPPPGITPSCSSPFPRTPHYPCNSNASGGFPELLSPSPVNILTAHSPGAWVTRASPTRPGNSGLPVSTHCPAVLPSCCLHPGRCPLQLPVSSACPRLLRAVTQGATAPESVSAMHLLTDICGFVCLQFGAK